MRFQLQDAYRTPLLLLFAYMIAYIATYVFNVFFANALGASVYGDFALGMRVLSIASPLILLGTTASSRRFISNFLTKEKHADISRYIFWNARLFLCTASITVLTTTLSILLLILLHIYNIHDIRSYHIAIYLLYVAPIVGLTQVVYSILLAYNRFMFATYLTNVMPYVLMNVFLFLVWSYVSFIHSILIAGIVLCAYLSALLSMIIYIHMKVLSINLKKIFAERKESTSTNKKLWIKTAKRFMLNGLVFTFINAIDLLTIELVLKKESLVGYYAAALTITKIILLIRVAFNAFISIQVTQLLENKPALQSILNKISSMLFSVVVITCTLMMIFSTVFLRHFGPDFIVVNTPLLILIIGTGAAVFLTPGTMSLLYSQHEKLVLKINITTLFAYLIFCPLMTYYFGLVGTAITSAILETIPRILMALMARHYLAVRTCLLF